MLYTKNPYPARHWPSAPAAWAEEGSSPKGPSRFRDMSPMLLSWMRARLLTSTRAAFLS